MGCKSGADGICHDPDEVVTVIVSLEDVPATVLGSLRGKEAQHQRVQMEIADLVAAKII